MEDGRRKGEKEGLGLRNNVGDDGDSWYYLVICGLYVLFSFVFVIVN